MERDSKKKRREAIGNSVTEIQSSLMLDDAFNSI